jgi:hypothetical protein
MSTSVSPWATYNTEYIVMDKVPVTMKITPAIENETEDEQEEGIMEGKLTNERLLIGDTFEITKSSQSFDGLSLKGSRGVVIFTHSLLRKANGVGSDVIQAVLYRIGNTTGIAKVQLVPVEMIEHGGRLTIDNIEGLEVNKNTINVTDRLSRGDSILDTSKSNNLVYASAAKVTGHITKLSRTRTIAKLLSLSESFHVLSKSLSFTPAPSFTEMTVDGILGGKIKLPACISKEVANYGVNSVAVIANHVNPYYRGIRNNTIIALVDEKSVLKWASESGILGALRALELKANWVNITAIVRYMSLLTQLYLKHHSEVKKYEDSKGF